jgi:16S rRNA (uracil1498-N3)-methyltransferase
MSARFFVAQDLQCQTEISLPSAIAHHIRVLRLETGTMITLFNGQGGEYQAQLSTLTKQHALAQILKFTPCERELPVKIILAQAIASGNKMDWLIEKAVELGVSAIQPLYTSRCVVKLSGNRAEQRVRHWQELVHAACEQCGRNQIPQVAAIQPLKDWLATSVSSIQKGVLLSPQGEFSLYQSAIQIKDVGEFTLLVGPEGGFAPEEERLVQRYNFLSTQLGARILRCETAGLSARAGLTALLQSFQV